MKYKRIIIIGPAGAGKTTLANHLASICNLPLIHLDHEYWLPNWQHPDEKEFRQKVERFAEQDEWIMEGNYYKTLDLRLQRADLVIELRTNRFECISGIIKRVNLTKKKKLKRDDLANGCYEKVDFALLKWSFEYKKKYAPILHEMVKKYPSIVHVKFNTRKQAHDYIMTLMEEQND